MTTKTLESVPPSMFTYLEYVDPLKSVKKLKEKDVTKTPAGVDFNTFMPNNISHSPLSKKVKIEPVSIQDRNGPKWYQQSMTSAQ